MRQVGAHLDSLSPEARLAATLALTRREQARLFEACEGVLPITLESLVSKSTPEMTVVAHEGKNSLLAFTRFAKVFWRPTADGMARQLWGYNRNPPLVATFVGPGYFVAWPETPGEVLIDYLQQPPTPLEGAPKIIPNSSRLGLFVYHRTQDRLRGLSQHVTIGRATRRKKAMDNWFVLCRTEPVRARLSP